MKAGMEVSTTNWLRGYCSSNGVRAISRRINVAGGSLSRHELKSRVGRELASSLFLPEPIAIRLQQFLSDDRVKQEVVLQAGDFIALAELLTHDAQFVIESMGIAARYYDSEVFFHQARVAQLSANVSHQVEEGETAWLDLFYAGLLHDFGKVGLPQEVLNQTQPWSDNEKEMKRVHLLIGLAAIGAIPCLRKVAEIVRCNHYYDGYPDGIKGEEIPLPGQILSAVDYFDALTHPRPSRRGQVFSASEALEKIERRRTWKDIKTPYDPRIISALRKYALDPHGL